jgi:putative phage-type endonuclease
MITVHENLEQGSPEWHALRRRHRMASLAPAVMGVDPWQTRASVIKFYRGEPRPDISNAPPIVYGNAHEPDARAAAAAELGELLYPIVVTRGDYGASLDGAIFTHEGAIEVVIECKAPYKGEESSTFIGTLAGDIGHYRWQVQHQLMVTGAEKALFYVWTPGPCAAAWINADPLAQEQLRAEWDKLMAEVDAAEVRSDEAWAFACDKWRLRKRMAADAARSEEEARQELLALVQAGVRKTSGCGVVVTRAEVKGTVDYSKVPELRGVNLDAYRKPPTTRITVSEEEA